MRKQQWISAALMALAFSGCATSEPVPPPVATPPKVEEEGVWNAPGMIPAACETLLQKSQEWGYKPGEKWKPANAQQALQVADFFAAFTLVPEASSRALRNWVSTSVSANEEQARESMKKVDAMQFCDHTLAMVFLDAILEFKWPKEARPQVARDFTQFLLNQQSRVSLLESRAVTIHVLKGAREKGLMPGSIANVAKLRMEIQKAKAALAPLEISEKELNELDAEKSLRKELALSENIRERLSREVPLP